MFLLKIKGAKIYFPSCYLYAGDPVFFKREQENRFQEMFFNYKNEIKNPVTFCIMFPLIAATWKSVAKGK